MDAAGTWTIAYRKPRANRFLRASDFAGTWAQAMELAGRFAQAHPELQVFYVPTLATEQANPGHVDNGTVLTDTGRRVRILAGGTVGDIQPLSEDDAQADFEWGGAVFVGERTTECPAKYREQHGLPFVADPANPTDDELAAAIQRGLANGSLIDLADVLARSEARLARKAQAEANEPICGTRFAHETGACECDPEPAEDAEGLDRARTVTHPDGITQVFATAQADRAAGESAIDAYQRYDDSYRTYAVDGSSLGVWDTEAEAYRAIIRNAR